MKLATTLLVAVLTPLAAEAPRQSPEFTINLPQGGQMLLSSQRGKVVCLEFLFTSCPHCQQASQLMNKLYTEYGPRGFQPIGVAFNEMSQMLVPDFIRDFQVKFPVGYANREAVQSYLGIPPDLALHVPQIVFIDRSGIIRQQSLPRNDSSTATEPNMRSMIEKLLSERAAPATKAAPVKKKAS